MPQNADVVKDHARLFQEPEYQALFERKAAFECRPSEEEVAKIAEWTKSWDYREKNFAREAAVINPAKACQPLGAVFAAAGFANTLSFVHGSQGCSAYYRSHLSRHFKEPSAAVSSSMTEDAAVFGGLNNMIEGLSNAYTLYKPEMIAVSTTCMAEVIGDDLHAFIGQAKEKGSVPADFDVPFAHTPAFVGSHTTGYDNMIKGILTNFWEGKNAQERSETNSINIIPGFDGYCVGNNRELMRMLGLMGVSATIIGDASEVYDTPTDGHYRMYAGGTTRDECRAALNAKGTISMQGFCTTKTLPWIEAKGQKTKALHYPLGVRGTDEFLLQVAAITGCSIPEALEKERGRLVDAIADSAAYLHGKRFAIFGDPDVTLGLTRFLLDVGAEPVHVLATNGDKEWDAQMQALLASSPFGKDCKAWPGKDLWHMRSLLLTEPVDFLIGSSYGKFLERDCKVPLIRVGFPIFDRHHHHRSPIWGYQGGLNLLVRILDTIFDAADREALATTGISFDLTR